MRKYVFIVFSLFIFSCTKVEKLEDMDITESKLNVICLVKDGERFRFQIYKSLSVFDNARLKTFLQGATVLLSEDKSKTETIVFSPDSNAYLSKMVATRDKLYEITISHPDLPTVRSSCHVIGNANDFTSGFSYLGSSVETIGSNTYTFLHNQNIWFGFARPTWAFGGYLKLRERWALHFHGDGYKWASLDQNSEPSNPGEYRTFQPDIYSNRLSYGGNQNTFYLAMPESELTVNFRFRSTEMKNAFIKGEDTLRYISCDIRLYDKASFMHVKTVEFTKFRAVEEFTDPVQISGNIENGYGVFGSYCEFSLQIPVKK